MANRGNIRYVPDRRGAGEILTSEQMLAVMVAYAEAGKAYAESIAPRRSGAYAQSFVVETERRGGPRGDRAEARLVNTARYAAAVEFDNNGGQRVLGRTVDHMEGGAGV